MGFGIGIWDLGFGIWDGIGIWDLGWVGSPIPFKWAASIAAIAAYIFLPPLILT
jgi:hypothetical protein